jgi:hypothetical protein
MTNETREAVARAIYPVLQDALNNRHEVGGDIVEFRLADAAIAAYERARSEPSATHEETAVRLITSASKDRDEFRRAIAAALADAEKRGAESKLDATHKDAARVVAKAIADEFYVLARGHQLNERAKFRLAYVAIAAYERARSEPSATHEETARKIATQWVTGLNRQRELASAIAAALAAEKREAEFARSKPDATHKEKARKIADCFSSLYILDHNQAALSGTIAAALAEAERETYANAIRTAEFWGASKEVITALKKYRALVSKDQEPTQSGPKS